jgi:hypothetical protein
MLCIITYYVFNGSKHSPSRKDMAYMYRAEVYPTQLGYKRFVFVMFGG